MNSDVDLSQLAIDRDDRGGGSPVDPGRHVLTRYVLPAALLLGALALISWASRDLVFPPLPVQVIPVLASRADVQQAGTPVFQAAGWIEPRPTPVRVAALAPGVVEQLLVVEDQEVKAGEPIAELVKQDARLNVERAQADLSLQEAELEVVRATLEAATIRFAQPVHLEAVLGQAEAELAGVATQLANLPFEIRRAEARLLYARRSYEGKAGASAAVPVRAVEQARSEFDAAQSLVEELQLRVDSLSRNKSALVRRRDALQKQLELRTDERQAKQEAAANVRAAAARVRQAEVALAEARLQLDRMTVPAPIAGRVLHLIAHPGSRLTVGRGQYGSHDASTVVTLYRPDMLQVRVDVRFEDLPRVEVGQPVSITSPAVTSPISGRVLLIGSEADIQKNTLQVKVAIDSPVSVLKPEMLVDTTFLAPPGQQQEAASSGQLRLFVPRQLVKQHDSGTYVWIADQSAGVARRTPIEIGRPGVRGLVEVANGLQAASRLIATAHDDLRDGRRIEVTGEMAGAAGAATVAGGSP